MTGQSDNSETVLVVEDDVALLQLIQRQLHRHGYVTDGVSSGVSALQWLQNNSARLMLLDYSLSDMRGEELLDRLDENDSGVPFIVATGNGSETVAVEMMKRGARNYLVKGSAFLELLPAVVHQTFVQLTQENRLAQAEDELRQAHAELEQRVQQRTAELAEANARLRVEMEERRRAEERARQHQSELAHVARLSTMGEIVTELAHELNQPLAAISCHTRACVHLLQPDRDHDVEELRSSMDHVGKQADRAGEIIRRLRRFVRKAQPTRTTMDINTLIREVFVLVEGEARSVEVDVRFEFADALPPVTVDRIQIEQVLVNLIHNALDAMRNSEISPRVLTIRTQVGENNSIEVAVHDRGDGISEEDLPKIFDRFFTTRPDGMGMGLAISRSIAENHGGTMTVTTTADQGTTFHMNLPASNEG
ncbi:MAG TPA: ATP-binding protein [Thermoguttaceae bacterium]|nr:ATP-binding protein [Thermoguttaceae bacterium]